MAEKKQEFVVSDRRRFAPEGELRPDAQLTEEDKVESPAAVEAVPAQPVPKQETVAAAPPEPTITPDGGKPEAEMPEPPTVAEQQEQKDAYHASGRKVDDILSKAGSGRAAMPEMTFERLVESFYMTALLQMGAIRQEGEAPAVDIIGARQTIDSLTILQEKTKGNLADREQSLLQNVLFELRMAWIEITNALATAKPGPGPGPGLGHEKK